MSENELITQRGNLDQAIALGKLAFEAKIFPDIQSAAQATMKIIAGAELGLGAFVAMRDIFLIKGKVAISATQIGSRIKQSGKYDYEILELSDQTCRIQFSCNGKALEPVSEFSLDDARRAGLIQKEGGMYEKYRRNMLFSRALTNGARWHTPDVFNGPIYTPDELRDEPIDVTPVATSRSSTPPASNEVSVVTKAIAKKITEEKPENEEVASGKSPVQKPTDTDSMEYIAWVTELSHGTKAGKHVGDQPYKYLKNYLANYKKDIPNNELLAINTIMQMKLSAFEETKAVASSPAAPSAIEATQKVFPGSSVVQAPENEVESWDFETLGNIKVLGGKMKDIEFKRIEPGYLQAHLDSNKEKFVGVRAWYARAISRYLDAVKQREAAIQEKLADDDIEY